MSRIALDLGHLGWADVRFFEAAITDGLDHIREAEWRTSQREPPAGMDIIAVHDRLPPWASGGCARFAEGLLAWRLHRGRVWLQLAGADAAAVGALLCRGARLFPQSDDGPHRLDLRLWSCARDTGGDRRTRTVSVPEWPDIADNYTASARARLDDLHSARLTGTDGRLLLWHGAPGTGKTHAVRSLGWAWRGWCDLHYVVDPERLLDRPDYLFDVLGDDEGDELDSRWSLLVLEDTGELLYADARERAGQGLSRFLNVLDGLLGQGTRTLVLLTTNEPLGALHPAVTRPGRCAAQVEFAALTTEEATAWRERQGVVAPAGGGGGTLAELYADIRGSQARSRSAATPIGFR
ncbi:hypothetical protein DSM112329_04713 [Paraconexibacter sp. AEG42_29]|uniref:AAA family ATPase n=1 Tax=Paraconexibacter sp. AEG42_29 TaxID=2997339 RepID=A0AAU7B2I8_9ACTN